MMYKASRGRKEVSYCFSGSSDKLQCHRGQKMADSVPIWSIPDDNYCLRSWFCYQMTHIVLGTWKRFPIVSWGHLSNSKVTWATNSTISWISIRFEQVNWAGHNYEIPGICLYPYNSTWYLHYKLSLTLTLIFCSCLFLGLTHTVWSASSIRWHSGDLRHYTCVSTVCFFCFVFHQLS